MDEFEWDDSPTSLDQCDSKGSLIGHQLDNRYNNYQGKLYYLHK